MNNISTITVTIAILAISVALFLSHREQADQIKELSRQLFEVLKRDGASSEVRHLQELPSGFTYASEFGAVGDSMANDGPGELLMKHLLLQFCNSTHITSYNCLPILSHSTYSHPSCT